MPLNVTPALLTRLHLQPGGSVEVLDPNEKPPSADGEDVDEIVGNGVIGGGVRKDSDSAACEGTSEGDVRKDGDCAKRVLGGGGEGVRR